MSAHDAKGWREDLAAYADQSLGGERREQVGAHLVGCDGCRRELAELEQLRGLLGSGSTAAPAVPGALADRLVAIAGDQAGQELWLAPERDGQLPSPRHRRRVRAAALASMTTAGVLGALGGAWLMAPELPTVEGMTPGPGGAGLPGSARARAGAEPCPHRYACPDSLLGMPLEGRRVDAGGVTSSYAFAGSRVVVTQAHGRLADDEQPEVLEMLAAPQEQAPLHRVVWQSGETVIDVVATNQHDARAAAAALPHEAPVTGEGMERVRLGLERLAGQRGR